MIASQLERATPAVAPPPLALRVALRNDAPAIVDLQQRSLRALSRGFYDESQVETFMQSVPTLEEHLLEDRTFFVAERAGWIIGCGGWSRRVPAYQSAGFGRQPGVATLPKVRAMYVHPDVARQGIGRALLDHIERDMARHGCNEAGLDATLPGVPLYRACGYRPLGRTELVLPNGIRMPVVSMHKRLARAGLPGTPT